MKQYAHARKAIADLTETTQFTISHLDYLYCLAAAPGVLPIRRSSVNSTFGDRKTGNLVLALYHRRYLNVLPTARLVKLRTSVKRHLEFANHGRIQEVFSQYDNDGFSSWLFSIREPIELDKIENSAQAARSLPPKSRYKRLLFLTNLRV